MAVAQFRGQFGGKIGRLVAPDLLKGDNVGIEPRKGRPAMGGAGLAMLLRPSHRPFGTISHGVRIPPER